MDEHTWIDDGNERCFVCMEDVSQCECTEEEIEAFFDRVTADYFPHVISDLCSVCGNYPMRAGYRVCASCVEAREYAPHLWADQPPDKLDA